MELAKRTLMKGLRNQAGMENMRTIMVEKKSILEKEQAIQYLTKFFPEILIDFKAGKFDTLTIGPFGTQTSKEDNGNQDNLCLKNLQYHWEFSKLPMTDRPKSEEDTNSRIDFSNGKDFTLPDKFKWADPRMVDSALRTNGNPETDVIAKMPLDQIEYYRKFATQMAHHLIFEIWGKHFGVPYLAEFLGTEVESKIKNTFF